jgi:hypothetical protein
MANLAKIDHESGPKKSRRQVILSLIGCVVCVMLGILSLEMVVPSVNSDPANPIHLRTTVVLAIVAAIFFWQAFRLVRRAIRE